MNTLLNAAALVLGAATGYAAGHWTFDGDLADRSGNRLDGSMAAVPVFAASPRGQALRFGRDPVTVPDAPALRLAAGIRIDCRVRLASFPDGNAWADIVVKGDYALRVNPASEGHGFGFFINTGGWEPRVNSRLPATTNVWYEISAGWDGKELWLTVNGDTTRTARDGAPVTTWEPLRFGRFDGDLGEVRIQNPAAPRPRMDDAGLSPGFRLDCLVRFDEVPSDTTLLVSKEGEYMLRLDSQREGGLLSFFVNLGGWEPRVCASRRIEPGVTYRVSARWDGIDLTLDVNGDRKKMMRTGVARSGDAPLTLGRINGKLDLLSVENPRPDVVRLRGLATDSVILRSGRAERIAGVVRNFSHAVTGCVVTLDLPDGAVCEGPAAFDFGTLPAFAERAVEWRVRAAEAGVVPASFRLDVNGRAGEKLSKPLAFFPPEEPDRSAAAWEPPSGGAGAVTYHVDSRRGDNANSGTSPDAPWRDFTPVNGRVLGPGERLLLRRGSVFNQELAVSAKGTAEAWAELGTYGEGPRPVIRRNWDIDERCVLVRDPDYLRIRGLTVCFAGKGLVVNYARSGRRGLLIEDCVAHHIEGLYRRNSHGIPEWRDREGAPGDARNSSAGIGVFGHPSSDAVIRDCEMFQCSMGFFASGDNLTVDRVFCHDNFAHNTSPHPVLASIRRSYLQNSIFDAAGWHAHAGTMGIMLANPVGLIIRNCHFLNQPDSGSHDQGGIDFENTGEGCLIDRCTFRNNAGAAVEVLGLQAPQPKNIEIANSRFIRNNVAHKLGPSEIFIWGEMPNPDVCCSTGIVRDNGFALHPGVVFFTNQAPATTRWVVTNNTEYASGEDLARAMPFNEPPAVDAGREIWTDCPVVRLPGMAIDDARPAPARLAVRWEMLHGPGDVAFSEPGAAVTDAVFSGPGDYLLRLVADDGELWRSALTTVHVLPPRTAVTRAWTFETTHDKEGWTDWNLGTRKMEWTERGKIVCVSHPVKHVAGGYYIVAVEDAPDAHLLSPDALDLPLAVNPTVAICFQNHTPATRMRVRFTTEASPSWEANLGQPFAVAPHDSGPRLYMIDMRGVDGWRGTLKQIRLDLSDGVPLTGTCRIDYMWTGNAPAQ